MRALADTERIRRFLQALDAAADRKGVCYLTGGATAVLLGWRATTVDVDLELVPEQNAVMRAVPRLEIEPQLYRFPAIDPPAFRVRVERIGTELA